MSEETNPTVKTLCHPRDSWLTLSLTIPEESGQVCRVRICQGLFDPPRETFAVWSDTYKEFWKLPAYDDIRYPEVVTHWRPVTPEEYAALENHTLPDIQPKEPQRWLR